MQFDSRAWEKLREHAAAQLPPNFADNVLRAARHPERPERARWKRLLGSPLMASVATAAACLLAAIAYHAYRPETAAQRPVVEWRDAASQESAAVRERTDAIKSEFRQQLNAVLTPAQRDKLRSLGDRTGAPHANEQAARAPAEPIDSLVPIVLIPSTLETLSRELQLTDDQKSAVHGLLVARRTRLLELVDANPPPSLKLERVAPGIPQTARPDTK